MVETIILRLFLTSKKEREKSVFAKKAYYELTNPHPGLILFCGKRISEELPGEDPSLEEGIVESFVQ